ncbi:MAG: hypothetical protein EOP48_15140 [Sphingobacteriales bacterium]|nr:MAG: hypothetical protein EOP48_15140 [Sphingobacteriales bacterium]
MYDEVLSKPKGTRSNPENYLPATYIAEKLSMFDSGIVRIVKRSGYDEGKLYSGDEGFAMPESEFNRLKAKEGGSFKGVAARLDLGVTAKADDYFITRLDRSQVTDLRLATGDENPQFVEYGANLYWLPGAKTKSGTVEAVFKVSQNIDLTILKLPLP